ncbi:MAG: sensor histidine kinase [Gemmatimonadales bacterium]
MSRPSSVPRTPPLKALLIGALVLALITSAQHWTVMQLGEVEDGWKTVWHAVSKEAPVWFLWILFTPVAHWAIRRWPLVRGRLGVVIPLHVTTALLAVLAHQALLLAAHRLLGFPTPTGAFLPVYLQGVIFRIAVGFTGYGVLFGAVLATDYYARMRDRELAAEALGRQLAEARLDALRMQLNPHFLFNTMNTIAMLVRRGDGAQAVEMLAGLSDLLRHVLVDSPPQETSLRNELAFIERYLEIERVRFADRLQVTIDVPPDLLDAEVPSLVLQPLVENAIRHGIAKRARAGQLGISARAEGDRLRLEVRDDGPGFEPRPNGRESSPGIGIRNTRSRIDQLYGPAASLSHLREADSTIARVEIPLRRTTVGAGMGLELAVG